MAELSSNRTGGNGVQVETENENFAITCSCSPQILEFGHFNSRCCLAEHGKEMYQMYNASAGLLFFLLNPNVL